MRARPRAHLAHSEAPAVKRVHLNNVEELMPGVSRSVVQASHASDFGRQCQEKNSNFTDK